MSCLLYVCCRAAYKWWSEALDALLGVQNAVHDWSSVLKNSVDVSADLLKRCGLWGCLLAAIISSNIAQYVRSTALTVDYCHLFPEHYKIMLPSVL